LHQTRPLADSPTLRSSAELSFATEELSSLSSIASAIPFITEAYCNRFATERMINELLVLLKNAMKRDKN
jgi:hypothetical protein